MSEFSVHSTSDTIPALKYCLILDGERIAGGKPDYRGNNHLISWSTRETYGPIDKLNAENDRLREQIHWLKQGDILHVLTDQEYIDQCERERLMQVSIDALDKDNAKLRESLERAAGIIADICGECPVSRYEWLSNDGCAEKCGSVTEDECWIAYLTGKRWDESGTEVDR